MDNWMTRLSILVFAAVLAVVLHVVSFPDHGNNVVWASAPDTRPSAQGSDSSVTLALKPNHPSVAKFSSIILSKNHYAPRPLNDSLSAAIYQHFLKSMDYSRLYFLKSDINEFESLRYRLDDMITGGELDPVFTVFNRFLERFRNRMSYALSVSDSAFNYDANEDFLVDREEAGWFTSQAEQDQYWRQRVKYEILSVMVNGKDSLAAETVKKRYRNLLKQSYRYKSDEVFQLFMNAYTESLDPHSNYFSPRTSENFRINMSLSLEGIGAQLIQDNDYVQIRELIPGGPAAMSKTIQPKDRILAVGQGDEGEMVDVVGWRVDDVVQLIRGPKGTVVRLLLVHDGDPVPGGGYTIRLVRDKIKLEEQAAKSEIIPIKVNGREEKAGIIHLPTFYTDFEGRNARRPDFKSTTRDVAMLIDSMKTAGITSLVMDLRRNGGGSLDEAVELTGLFIDQGPVVQVRHYNNKVNINTDTNEGVVWNGPLVVIIDRYSASASEIFAAAIQDYGRGIIIGEPSFGKGTVQTLDNLGRYIAGPSSGDFGQLKYTIAKFYRVNGGSTQMKGVTPDIEFPVSVFSSEVGERTEQNALPWDAIAPAKYEPVRELEPVIGKLTRQSESRRSANPEFSWILSDKNENQAEEKRKVVKLNRAAMEKERDLQTEKNKLRNEERKKRGTDEKSDPVLIEAAWIGHDLAAALTGR
ncbi:MAG: carboxy terminal-processing peptidase [Bacteroidetes bacterium]|nr:carboxy terminal-processing peptidase [Bacteroidota bacterium]